MIFVTVGTHEQPFNRLIQKVDELKRDGIIKDDTAHARIYDRLLELCTPIACTGPSMRKDIGQAKLNLLKTLLA